MLCFARTAKLRKLCAPSQLTRWTLMQSGGGGESFAPVFQALAADMYALDLVIKATLQKDVSLIKLPPPPTPKQNKCLS